MEGKTWRYCRDRLGGPKFVIVGEDEKAVWIVRADYPKKHWKPSIAGEVPRSVFAREYVEVS